MALHLAGPTIASSLQSPGNGHQFSMDFTNAPCIASRNRNDAIAASHKSQRSRWGQRPRAPLWVLQLHPPVILKFARSTFISLWPTLFHVEGYHSSPLSDPPHEPWKGLLRHCPRARHTPRAVDAKKQAGTAVRDPRGEGHRHG
jgi:hypothetical protein